MTPTTTQATRRSTGVSGRRHRREITKPQTDGSRATFNIVARGHPHPLRAAFGSSRACGRIKTSLTPNATAALGARPILKDTSPTLHVLYDAADRRGHLELVRRQRHHLGGDRGADGAVRLDGGLRVVADEVPGRRLVFVLMIGGIMVPAQVLIVPIFQELNAVATC